VGLILFCFVFGLCCSQIRAPFLVSVAAAIVWEPVCSVEICLSQHRFWRSCSVCSCCRSPLPVFVFFPGSVPASRFLTCGRSPAWPSFCLRSIHFPRAALVSRSRFCRFHSAVERFSLSPLGFGLVPWSVLV
jgi:hypothetical protein